MMKSIIKCPQCGNYISIILSQYPPFYKCKCGYDSRGELNVIWDNKSETSINNNNNTINTNIYY